MKQPLVKPKKKKKNCYKQNTKAYLHWKMKLGFKKENLIDTVTEENPFVCTIVGIFS